MRDPRLYNVGTGRHTARFMSILINVLIAFHVLVCVLMVGVVLMQRPKNEGLGAAFGGGMTENIFGAQTTHVLQKFTVWLGIVFFALTLLLAILYAKRGTGAETEIQKELLSQPVPAAQTTTEAQAAATPVVATTEPVATEAAEVPAAPAPEAAAPTEPTAPVPAGN